MKRFIEDVIVRHFHENRQMVFLSGPRQVGKTTLARQVEKIYRVSRYFSWDNQSDRALILQGQEAVAKASGVQMLCDEKPLCLLDEIHRYGKWKGFLKGLHDCFHERLRVLVTGSARLDVYKAGGDSLMGRYFPYRMHPLSVGELSSAQPTSELIRPPSSNVTAEQFAALLTFGGFPEPFLRQERRFWNRWRRLRTEQLLKEDLRDLTRIQETGQVEVLAELIRNRVGQLVSFSTLARAVNASVDSVRRWINTLETMYYCFSLRPWHKNVARSLRKEPKYYLWDWSMVEDYGARAENLVASALLKSVHHWTDQGEGAFGLFFLRDKQKREVDFLVTRDRVPWFLIEVKTSAKAGVTESLKFFQDQISAPHAFQVSMESEPVLKDCFSVSFPVVVPARTFLSQLI